MLYTVKVANVEILRIITLHACDDLEKEKSLKLTHEFTGQNSGRLGIRKTIETGAFRISKAIDAGVEV